MTEQGIQLDDKKRLWWLQTGVPLSIRNANGDGKWVTGTWRCLDDENSLGDVNISQVCLTSIPSKSKQLIIPRALQVRELLSEREMCRQARNFERADVIHEKLTAELGIVIDDKKRTWRKWPDSPPN